MIRLSYAGLVLALLGLSGCTWINIKSHVAAQDYSGSPKRVLLLNGLDERFSTTLPSLFADAFVAVLGGCGVAASSYRPSALELNVGPAIQAQIETFRPDAILSIRQTDRIYSQGTVVRGIYIATFTDIGMKREVWKAEFEMGGLSSDEKNPAGRRLANLIVRQLGLDNIVKSCPSLPPAG